MKNKFIILTLVLTMFFSFFCIKKTCAYSVRDDDYIESENPPSSYYPITIYIDANGGKLSYETKQNGNTFTSYITSKNSFTGRSNYVVNNLLVNYTVGTFVYQNSSSSYAQSILSGSITTISSTGGSITYYLTEWEVYDSSNNLIKTLPHLVTLDSSDNIPISSYGNVTFKAIYGFRGTLKPNQDDLENEYHKGYDDGLSDGYDYGYDDGLLDGFDNGYNNGYDDGYDCGYNLGLDYGIDEGERINANFGEMILNVLDAPRQALANILNFDFLGVNLGNLVFFLISSALVVFVIKFFI